MKSCPECLGEVADEARACRHCGALLADDESDDDCSSVFRALESRGTRL